MTETTLDTRALAGLLATLGHDTDDLAEILDDYRAGAAELVATLRQSARTGDIEALRIAAHTLKSNARDVGAQELAARCAALERACLDGGPENPVAEVEAIARDEAAARGALDRLDLHELPRP
ncbi:Hpt domain-containing protein [Tranquillimonas rosea]|uniref:Hpt domain-containing protein n=1 Tax=Tranquillimonas rosea TaxID=641238 RepID=A0A1H9WUR2_9RHOB|nr:Hpt domain-containing protein [Tranquillimonas rosea]SES37646.1 Hpt domain-containing protein [Tranquillimonas rosea]